MPPEPGLGRSEAESDFLRRLNADLPEGVDWKSGAVSYLRELVADGGADTERFHLTKPFVGGPDFNPFFVDAFYFLDVLKAIGLPARSRILDVGCGPGWTVHWLAKLGHQVVGLDISAELLDVARRRMQSDPFPPFVGEPMAYDLRIHDIEAEPVALDHPVDLALLESTLHHFFDPVAALRNVAADLADDGVVAVIEASAPPIGSSWHAENVELMRRYHTIERPYTRDQLHEMLGLAGLTHVEFFRPINGLFRQHLDAVNAVTEELVEGDNINIVLAGTTGDALRRLVPDPRPLDDQLRGVTLLDGASFTEARPDGTIYRWCGPRVQLMVNGAGPHRLRVENVTLGRRDRQNIFVLVDGTVVQRIELGHGRQATHIVIEVPPRTRVELHSDRVFSPSWSGAPDPRLLSYTLDELF